MKVGFVVDGVSEYRNLKLVFPQLAVLSGHDFIRILRADLQPYQQAGSVAKRCQPTLRVLEALGAELIVVLIDREQQDACAGALSRILSGKLAGRCQCPVEVVVKDRCFENWLVANPDALRRMPKRFQVGSGLRRQVEPGMADHVDALKWLSRVVLGSEYDKVQDGKRILEDFDVAAAARNSRSLRRLLRVVGVPAYRQQSRAPV